MAIETVDILDGGEHIVTAAWKQLDPSDDGFRLLTFRLEENAASAIRIGVKTATGEIKDVMYLKAIESWTFGPNAGTIRPSKIYLKGTANDVVNWIGTKV